MRVVHAFRGFHDYLSELVNSEVEGSEVHVLVPQCDVPILTDLKSSVHVHRTEMPRVRSLLNAVRLPALGSLIRQIDPDIVHLQSGIVWEYGLMLARRRFPIILTVHDIVNHSTRGGMLRTPDFITACAIRSADALIVHGDSSKGLLLKRFGQKGGASRVYSVDHGVISRYGNGSARLVVPRGSGNVLFFGRIDEYKGLEYLIRAEAILRSFVPALSMIVAGATSRPAYYRRLVGSAPGISLRLGYQDRESVEELFRWADVVVLPYIEASQSGVLQIATAFGVPSVATRVGGFPDVIRDRLNGLLVPPRDPLFLATAIRELLTDSGLRAQIIGNLQSDREKPLLVVSHRLADAEHLPRCDHSLSGVPAAGAFVLPPYSKSWPIAVLEGQGAGSKISVSHVIDDIKPAGGVMVFDLAKYKEETQNFTTKNRRDRVGITISALEYILWFVVGRAWQLFYHARIMDDSDLTNPLIPVPARFEQKHVERCRIFANREEMLKSLRKGKTWAEVGTYEGAFARKIIDICEPSHLDLMDLSFDFVKARGYVQETEIVTFDTGDSANSLLAQPDNKYDYIYIDAGHDLMDVARDVEAAKLKLNADGLMIFNDYICFSHADMRPFGIVPVVNSLVAFGNWEVACFAFQFKMYCDIALRCTQIPTERAPN